MVDIDVVDQDQLQKLSAKSQGEEEGVLTT
jgi:hypothetical protein